jgi:hypothetical protein
VQDLELGKELTVYGRTMVLCNCDEFTKAFFEKNELPIGNAIEMPVDP